MNKPLILMNNNLIAQQLKCRIWEDYQNIKNNDFQMWLEGLSPLEKAAWKAKFNEINEKTLKNG